MFRLLRPFLSAVLLSAPVAFAAPWVLPPVDGTLAGALAPTMLPGAPVLDWRITVRTAKAGARDALLQATGAGSRLRIEATVEPRTGNGTWRIVDAAFDAARWVPSLAGAIGGSFLGVSGTGTIRITGTGTIRGGIPAGAVRLSWSGSLRKVAAGWTLAGVSVDGRFAFDAATGALHSTAPAIVTVRTITTSRFGARNLAVAAQLEDLRRLALRSATIEIAGGDVQAAPTTILLQPLRATLDLTARRIGLQDVAALVPAAVKAARGRLDGSVRLNWTADGIEIAGGRFVLNRSEPAEIQLPPSPGLISSTLPPTVLKYYSGLKRMETGQMPIHAEELDITFSPAGDAEGRTASVHLVGGPNDPALHAPIDLQVNVRGPLESLVKFGTDSHIRFGGP